MKNIFLLTALSLQAIVYQSCIDADKKLHFKDIDNMLAKIDSLETAFKAMPNDSFSIVKKSAAELEKDVKTYFMEDTVDHEFARKMNRIRGIRKGADYILMRQAFLDTIFIFQRAQLNTLREDIENGSGKRDEYHNFIESEKENMTIISSSFNDYKSRFEAMRFEYYDVADEIRNRVRPFKEKAEQK